MLCNFIMNYGIEIQTTITREGLEELFVNCLCSWSIGYGTIKIGLDDEHYFEAKKMLISEGEEQPCTEPIIGRALLLGYPLQVEDSYSGEEFEITLDEMHKNFGNIEQHHIKRMLNIEDDACTHDSILQTLILGEDTYC